MGSCFLTLTSNKKNSDLLTPHSIIQLTVKIHKCNETISEILKFIRGSEAWGNKTKELFYSSLSLKMISFVLFPQASQPLYEF